MIKTFSETEFANCVYQEIAEKIVAWQKKNSGLFRLGVTGGSSVREIYQLLARDQRIDWQRVLLILTDERFVPAAHPESNLGMLGEALIFDAGIDLDNVLFFDTEEGAKLEASAEDMSKALLALLTERTPLFDLLILSVGPDFHLASLFPEHLERDLKLAEAGTLAEVTTTENFAIRERLSLSYRALGDNALAFILIRGTAKNHVKELVASMGDFEEVASRPLMHFLKVNADRVTVFVD